MFEGTLVESRGLEGTGTGRWTAVGSLAVQCAAVGLVILLPLLRPQMMTLVKLTPPVSLPLLHRPPVVVQTTTAARSGGAWSMPAASAPAAAANVAVLPSLHPVESGDEPAPLFDGQMPMRGGGDGPLRTLGTGTGPGGNSVAVVRMREAGPVKVSQGVAAGMLLAPIQPVYPAFARAAGIRGTVVIEAVISKTGRLESVHAVSGPPALQRAALDAVSAARYRPYLLNGEPAEVQTMFTVVFSLGG
jgi:protein TonB